MRTITPSDCAELRKLRTKADALHREIERLEKRACQILGENFGGNTFALDYICNGAKLADVLKNLNIKVSKHP